ncbi:MAG: L-threonylcarbamoyladenylate synthase [Oscillospiraceae bacterium]|jgi:L-threonylcarbamoyladenylate synthase|nr:threonylcarbamoyl-AMP synthase [Oscillospiraceae bacterium]MDY2611788.1 L-threonylcarbamoyladenylate synthase [Oscillospiraceae bacterium]
MDTQILKIASIFENPDELQQAADILARGGLVAFPTETVYGLGANGLDEEAVRSIYQAKGRPSDNPLILHICDTEMLPQLAREIPKAALKLALEFWPGPLTMVLPKTEQVPDVVSGGLDTVAIRFPSNLIARELIRRSGKPIAAPSANLSGSPSPTTAQHCIDDLMGRVDAIVDGGSCGVGLESTVISLAGEIPTVLRPGGVTVEQLRRVLSEVRVDPAVTHPMAAGQKAASPGMKYKHYAPKAKVVLVNGNTESFAEYVNQRKSDGVFALCFSEDLPVLEVPSVCYGGEKHAEEQAHALFDALRRLDDKKAQLVFAHCPSQDGVGLAVYNRLLRAAAFDVVKL